MEVIRNTALILVAASIAFAIVRPMRGRIHWGAIFAIGLACLLVADWLKYVYSIPPFWVRYDGSILTYLEIYVVKMIWWVGLAEALYGSRVASAKDAKDGDRSQKA